MVRIDGAPDAAVNRGHLCAKGRYAHALPRALADRLTRAADPRRTGALAPVSWDEAIALRRAAARRDPRAATARARSAR